MRKQTQLACLLLIVLAVPLSLARADDLDLGTTTAKKPPRIIYKKEQQQEYSGAKLKGELKKPELSYIYQRKGLRAEKIVNVPENFDEEIINGAGQF